VPAAAAAAGVTTSSPMHPASQLSTSRSWSQLLSRCRCAPLHASAPAAAALLPAASHAASQLAPAAPSTTLTPASAPGGSGGDIKGLPRREKQWWRGPMYAFSWLVLPLWLRHVAMQYSHASVCEYVCVCVWHMCDVHGVQERHRSARGAHCIRGCLGMTWCVAPPSAFSR
jgi:hypothetical protein